MPYLFGTDSEETKIIESWWTVLSNNPGDRAGLRRCHELKEVYFQPTFHSLRLRLKGRIDNEKDAMPLATVVALMAHVKTNEKVFPLARQMATPISGNKARVSELRFRRLLQCQNHEELFPMLLRIIRMLDGWVHIPSLAHGAYYWGDRIRQDWAMKYYSPTP